MNLKFSLMTFTAATLVLALHDSKLSETVDDLQSTGHVDGTKTIYRLILVALFLVAPTIESFAVNKCGVWWEL